MWVYVRVCFRVYVCVCGEREWLLTRQAATKTLYVCIKREREREKREKRESERKRTSARARARKREKERAPY